MSEEMDKTLGKIGFGNSLGNVAVILTSDWAKIAQGKESVCPAGNSADPLIGAGGMPGGVRAGGSVLNVFLQANVLSGRSVIMGKDTFQCFIRKEHIYGQRSF